MWGMTADARGDDVRRDVCEEEAKNGELRWRKRKRGISSEDRKEAKENRRCDVSKKGGATQHGWQEKRGRKVRLAIRSAGERTGQERPASPKTQQATGKEGTNEGENEL